MDYFDRLPDEIPTRFPVRTPLLVLHEIDGRCGEGQCLCCNPPPPEPELEQPVKLGFWDWLRGA